MSDAAQSREYIEWSGRAGEGTFEPGAGYKPVFAHERARQAWDWLHKRLKTLEAAEETEGPEYHILSRVSQFDALAYPDYTAPWHLLSWPHMRWEHVDTVVRLIERMCQPTGSSVGQPLRLEPFQIFILLAILGPEEPGTGRRLIKEGLLTLGRKNAKTTLMAALVLALLILRPESHGLRGQDVQVGASDRNQAGITYHMIERMIQLDKNIGVSRKFRLVPSYKFLVHNSTMTQLKCLSSDAYRAHGGNPAVVMLDEIGNVLGHQAEEFYSVLTTAFGAQAEPLTLLLSTQAPNDQHFFSQLVDRGRRINEGMIEDMQVAAFVFTLPEVDDAGAQLDPHDPDLWYLANPGLGTILRIEDMQDWSKRAKALPSLQNKYENLKLNRRVSETSALIGRQAWEACAVPYNLAELRGKRCWAGVDLAETTDMAALVLVFEEMRLGGRLRCPVVPYYWLPGDGLQDRCRNDKVPYDVWERQGLLDLKSPKTIDYGRIAEQIAWCLQHYSLQAIGFDRWKMKYLVAALADLDLEWHKDDNFLIEIGQGFQSQPRSIDLLEQAVLDERLAHGGHPILKWNAGNTVVKKDPSGNRKFEKAKSFGRIDGLVALAMALHARDEQDIFGDTTSSLNDPTRTMVL